jgi:C1A family cysteine protease
VTQVQQFAPPTPQNRFGAIKDKPDIRDFRYEKRLTSRQAAVRLPDTFDLGRRKIMPPVLDQLRWGSCVLNAVGNAIRFTKGEQKQLAVLPSRMALYQGARQLIGTEAWDSGCYVRDALKVANKQGAGDEALHPYTDENFSRKPSAEYFADAERNQIIRYERVEQDMQAIKEVLHGGDPIVFGFAVYESFDYPKNATTGTMPLPKDSEELLGWHAVGMYRYTKRRTGSQNSWNETWGAKGEFSLPWDYVLNPELADDFWRVIAVENPAIA